MGRISLERQARMLMWLVTVPLAGLLLVIGGIVGSAIWFKTYQHPGIMRIYGFAALYYLPTMLYIWAVWMIRAALREVANGALFDHVIPCLLSKVGLALLGGACFTVFGFPLIGILVDGRMYVRPFEPSPVTLGVVGAALFLFAQLLKRATAMRDELDGFV